MLSLFISRVDILFTEKFSVMNILWQQLISLCKHTLHLIKTSLTSHSIQSTLKWCTRNVSLTPCRKLANDWRHDCYESEKWNHIFLWSYQAHIQNFCSKADWRINVILVHVYYFHHNVVMSSHIKFIESVIAIRSNSAHFFSFALQTNKFLLYTKSFVTRTLKRGFCCR